MTLISVDVEADNTSPASGSMVCFGAVIVNDFTKTFYGQTASIIQKYNPEALAISGFSREEHEKFEDPQLVMARFRLWVFENSPSRPIFVSDNPAFDWQWINYYFDLYDIKNPFGFSARRIGDLYCGLVKDASKNHEWKKKYRRTKHTHNPVDDAMGNAEAIREFQKLGLKIKL
jgi:hypothetical protein